MAPVVLDYDGDGNVIGGHTVNELPDHRFADPPRARMKTQDSTPANMPDPAPVGQDQQAERDQWQQPHSQPSELPMYHQHSLPSVRPSPDHERAHSVQPPPFMQHPDLPPLAPRGHPVQEGPHSVQQHAQFSHDPRELGDRRSDQPTARYGYVRNPDQVYGFHSQSFAPPSQRHPSQVLYEPVGYRRGPESFAYQHQQSVAPQHWAYPLPHQDYQGHFQQIPHPPHIGGPVYRAAAYHHPGPSFQSVHTPYQQYFQSGDYDRRASSTSSKHAVPRPAASTHYESPYARGPDEPVQGRRREKESPKHKPSRVTAGKDELPVVRRLSTAGLPVVEDVFFKQPRPTVPASNDDASSARAPKSTSKGNGVTKPSKSTVAPAKSAMKEPAKKDAPKRKASKKSKQSPAPLLNRCYDCKKRHKKCEHLSRTSIDPNGRAGQGTRPAAVRACEDAPQPLPVPATRPMQSIVQPLDERQHDVSDADILALVPDEGVGSDSPSSGLSDPDPDPASEEDQETEVRYEEFLRTSSPEDDEGIEEDENVVSDVNANEESSPALAAANLLNKLHAQLYDTDPHAIEAFHQDANRYKTATLDEQEFYIRTYKLLRRANASNLLPDFVKCLPRRWNHTQTSWLDGQAELQLAKEGALLAGNVQIIPKEAIPKSMRKRRPRAAFKASESLEVIDPEREEQETSPDIAPSRSMFVRATPPGDPKSSATCDELSDAISEDNVVSIPKKAARKATKSKSRLGKAAKAKKVRRVPSTASAVHKIKRSTRPKKVQFGHLLASEVKHVGPCYTTRREVLRRGTNPYIHNLCGQGFPHPQEVRAHHRAKKCHDGTSSENWDEHASCKADYPELNYTKVRDGYVILDQASWDKLAAAVAAGEKEPDRLRGRELRDGYIPARYIHDEEDEEKDEDEDLDDSEDDAEHEVDEYFEAAMPSNSFPEEDAATPVKLAPAKALVSGPASKPRKRAASRTGGRAKKKVVVTAGNDRAVVTGATGPTTKATMSKESTKTPVAKTGVDADDGGSPAGLMARAAALGLRARFSSAPEPA